MAFPPSHTFLFHNEDHHNLLRSTSTSLNAFPSFPPQQPHFQDMVRTRGGGFAPRVPPNGSARRACVVNHFEKPPLDPNYSWLVKRARSKRRHTRKGPYSTASIKMLPRDVLVEVVANVASHSFMDLHNIKKCCKEFLDASEDIYILQRVSLDTFPLIQWLPNDKASSFFNRCKECGNIECLFREGLRKYFDYLNENIDGLELMKVAAQKGHKGAKYVCGMISLSSEDDNLKKQGLEHMRFLRKSKCVISSRNKVKKLLNFMWKKTRMVERNQTPLCNFKNTCKGWRVKKDRWILLDDDDEDDINLCEYCRWDYELEVFYGLFNVH